jgi:hypothetical protein
VLLRSEDRDGGPRLLSRIGFLLRGEGSGGDCD